MIRTNTPHAKVGGGHYLPSITTQIFIGLLLGILVGYLWPGFGVAIKPLAGMLSKFANPTAVKELSQAENVALVLLSAKVPSNGVRDGDQIDVYVMSQDNIFLGRSDVFFQFILIGRMEIKGAAQAHELDF